MAARPDVDGWDLVRYGPPGFEVYVRIAFAHDFDGAERDGEEPALREALATLVAHGHARYRIRRDMGGLNESGPGPHGAASGLPHRTMLLFTCLVAELRAAPTLAWYGSAQGVCQEPHLVWPDDQAWCPACEVDEEIEFTMGCSVEASQALASALPGSVRRVLYGESAPMYRN